jgi:hypothetical protein
VLLCFLLLPCCLRQNYAFSTHTDSVGVLGSASLGASRLIPFYVHPSLWIYLRLYWDDVYVAWLLRHYFGGLDSCLCVLTSIESNTNITTSATTIPSASRHFVYVQAGILKRRYSCCRLALVDGPHPSIATQSWSDASDLVTGSNAST